MYACRLADGPCNYIFSFTLQRIPISCFKNESVDTEIGKQKHKPLSTEYNNA